MPRLVSVAVPVPFLPPLTYRVPDGMAPPGPPARASASRWAGAP